MTAKASAKAIPPRTSESQCMLARMRPMQVRMIKMNMTKSRKIRGGRDLRYLGRRRVVRKKMVATTMTWVEGKEASPEPLGRVFKMMILSKTK